MKESQIISEMLFVLRDLQRVDMFLVVGLDRRLLNGHVDLLIGFDDGNIDKYGHIVEVALRNRWPTGYFFRCDDSIRFELPTCCGGVAIYDSSLLIRQVLKWIEGENLDGQYRSWVTGYWIPEALFGDLATAISLYNSKGIYSKIKELIIPYPLSLSVAISKLCVEEIRQKINKLEELYEKGALIEFSLYLSVLITSLVRLAFARSRCYLRGFRSLDDQICFLDDSVLPIYDFALYISQFKPKNREEINIFSNNVRKLLVI